MRCEVERGSATGAAIAGYAAEGKMVPAAATLGLLQAAIAGQQQQSLAIGIEPAGGINLRNRDELRQTTPVTAGLWRELA